MRTTTPNRYSRSAILFTSKTSLTAMMKGMKYFRESLFIFLVLLLSAQVTNSQTLYGTQNQGPAIVSYDIPTKEIAIVTFAPGSFASNLIIGSNTVLYGSLSDGGASGFGGIIAFDRTNSTVTTLVDFDAASGTDQSASVLRVKASDGKIYGNGTGGLFAFTPATSGYILVDGTHDFGNGNLIQGQDGKLYGTTTTGALFSFDLTSSTYTTVNADNDFGRDIMQAANGKIYGFTVGDSPNYYDYLYSFDLATQNFEKYTLAALGTVFPYFDAGAPLVESTNGKLYGTTTAGATDGNGAAFSFDPVTFEVTSIHDLRLNERMLPKAGLLFASNGNLYGTYTEGPEGNGAVFELGSTYSVSSIFSEDGLFYPLASTLVELPTLDIPCNLAATISIDSIKCANTKVSGKVEASGGSGGYLYSVDGGDFTQSPDLRELGAGDHVVIVKDAGNCQVTVPFTLGEPPVLSFTTMVTTLKPNLGQISVTAAGGTPPYQYQLNNEPFQSSNLYTEKNGTYYVTVKDENSCITARKQVIVIKPSKLTIDIITNIDIRCHGTTGNYSIFPVGGVEPYLYKADGGVYQSSNIFSLFAGQHTISIKDGEGTVATTRFKIAEPPLLTATYTYCDNTNGDVTLTIHASGGTPPYTYSFNSPFGPGNTFSGLQHSQPFTVRVQDAHGCIIAVSSVIGDENIPCNVGNKLIQQTLVAKAVLQARVIPSITRSSFKLIVDGVPDKMVFVSVTDISGRRLYQQTGKGSSQYIFGQNFARGVCLVHVRQGDQTQTLKVIKE